MNKSKTAESRTGAMSNYGWSTGTSGYDDEDRLVSWTRDDSNLSQSWTLTNEGDWSQFVENTTTENRTHGPAHELTAVGSTALSYDPKGNLTVDNTKSHNYTWDFDNRMSAADTDGDNTDDVTLQYDALGRRIAKTAGTSAVVYVSVTQPIQYSPFAGQVVAEYASGAAPSSPIEKYVYASYIDEPVLKDGTGGTVYYHRNSQYSVSALTSSTGAVVERYGYEPYGKLTILAADGSTVRASSSYANSYTYTGRRWDAELKLYYFRARYYDPGLGRFVERDPAGYVGGRNCYQVTIGLSVVDPSGLAKQWWTSKMAKGPHLDCEFGFELKVRRTYHTRPRQIAPRDAQFWQSNHIVQTLLVSDGTNCHFLADDFYIFDIVNIAGEATPFKLTDTITWEERDKESSSKLAVCFAVQAITQRAGFKLFGQDALPEGTYEPTANQRAIFEGNFVGPHADTRIAYVFFDGSHCSCCSENQMERVAHMFKSAVGKDLTDDVGKYEFLAWEPIKHDGKAREWSRKCDADEEKDCCRDKVMQE